MGALADHPRPPTAGQLRATHSQDPSKARGGERGGGVSVKVSPTPRAETQVCRPSPLGGGSTYHEVFLSKQWSPLRRGEGRAGATRKTQGGTPYRRLSPQSNKCWLNA